MDKEGDGLMIISVEDAIDQIPALEGWQESKIRRKLDSIESAIRQFCNNNFQNRNARMECPILSAKIYGTHQSFRVGDTVQITGTRWNDGLYTITGIDGQFTELSDMLMDESFARVTKVEYPKDIEDAVYDIMEWEASMREKVGIQSESLSRHSVTYFSQDASNTVEGYPVSLFGKCRKYRRLRC